MKIRRGAKYFFSLTLFAILSLLFSTIIVSAYQEGIYLIRPDSQYINHEYTIPEYLTVEDVTFVSCLEEEYVLHNSLLCLDDNSFEDLDSEVWLAEDNCYISSYNLENFECERLLLQAEYTVNDENYKMTKLIRVNKLSKVLDKILDTQYSDGGWQDPLSTAYAVWALSYFKDIYSYELDLALDWLKLERNNDLKCWPKSPCNVELSSNILALLSASNYTDARRVVNDARNWFEELQNDYEQGDVWNVSIDAVNPNTTLTLVSYDRVILDENFTLPLDEAKSYTFFAGIDKRLIIIADDFIRANITNEQGEILIEYQGDNLSYYVPGACWSLNKKGEPCDTTTSMYALASDIDEDQKDLAKDWAREELEEGAVLGYYFGDEESVIDTAMYLYNLYEDDEDEEYMEKIIDWILYAQNNEGSWDNGTTDVKLLPTAQAVLGLTAAGFNRTSEPIQDAEEWASDNEDNITLNNTAALGSAFFVLKHTARPIITSNPKVIVIDQPIEFIELFNPTTFNLRDLTYTFSDELVNDLAIEEREEIDAYSYRKLQISRTSMTKKQAFGFLTVENLGDPVAYIPVVLTDTPRLNITLQQTTSLFGTAGEIKGTATKSEHDFVCSVEWVSDEISTPGSVRIKTNSFTVPVRFTSPLTKEDAYTGTMYCVAAGKKISLPVSAYLMRYAAPPLTIDPLDAIINSSAENVIIHLKNNLDRDLTVFVSIDRYGSYFSFPAQVLLNPNQEYEFTLTNRLPTDLNLTSTALLDFSVLDRTESVSLLIDVIEQAPEEKSLMTSLFPILVVLIILSVLAYFAWKYRDVIFAELNKLNYWKIKDAKKKESKKIKTIKKTEHNQAIVNLYNIMKMQKKDDKDIAKRLTANFTREEVREALDAAGASLPVLDEEEPEKA